MEGLPNIPELDPWVGSAAAVEDMFGEEDGDQALTGPAGCSYVN